MLLGFLENDTKQIFFGFVSENQWVLCKNLLTYCSEM